MNTYQKFLTLFFSGLLILPFSLSAEGTGGEGEEGYEADDITAEIEVGTFYLDEDSLRFGKYSGLTDDGFDPYLNFKFESAPEWDDADPSFWSLQGWRLGLDSVRLEFDYRSHGKQKFELQYREIPNNRYMGVTPYNGIGTGDLSLPSNWVSPPNATTSSFATLQENLKPVEIGWNRKRLELVFDRELNKNWMFDIEWRHETKKGIKDFGAVIGNSGGNPRAVVLPAPMDWETDVMEASFDFSNDRYQFGFSMYASWFDNAQKSVTWDNAYGQRSGWAAGVGFPDGQGLYSLEPDNEAVQYRAYGAVSFNGSSRLSADVSIGTMEQNDLLFDYTVNPALEIHTPLPRNSTDAKIDTTFANIRYTAQPMDNVSVLASYTLDDRDNKTPRDEWIYVGGDSQDQKDDDEGRINLPYSYERKQWDLNATWRAAHGVRVKAGVQQKDYTRTYSEVLGSDETKFFAGITLRQWEHASLSFDFASSERDVDSYEGNRTFLLSHLPGAVDEDEFENLPGMRKYNQTDRERDEYRFRLDFFPAGNFNFALSGSMFEDDYNDTDGLFGLQESEVTSWSVDAGFYPRDGVHLTAFYTTEAYDSEQTNRGWRSSDITTADDPERNWMADSEDDVDTWNIALTFDRLGEKLAGDRNAEFGMDYTYSNVESNISLAGGSNAGVSDIPLPTLVSKMQSWSIFGKFEVNDHSAIRLSYEKQKLTTRDFALDNVPIDGPSNVLLLGNTSPNYDLSLIMLSYSYRY